MSAAANRAWALGAKHVPNWGGIFAPTRAGIMAALTESLEGKPPAVRLERLERLKLEDCTPEVREAMAGSKVRIWSGEHRQFWRPASSGYTGDVTMAGAYEFTDAIARTGHCGPEKRISFIPVEESN